jgi:hypothetical protein
MYRLKKGQESFTPVEGPFAKRTFAPGQLYGEIPPGEARRFEEIGVRAAETKKPARTDRNVGTSVMKPVRTEKGEVKS